MHICVNFGETIMLEMSFDEDYLNETFMLEMTFDEDYLRAIMLEIDF